MGMIGKIFKMYQIIANLDFYSVDIFSKNLIPAAGPILQYVFQYFYDIPVMHLMLGFL